MAVDLEQLSRERIYRTQAPCTQVLADMQQLREVDDIKEKKEAVTYFVGCGSLVIGAFAGFFGLFTLGASGLSSVLLPGALILLVVGIVAFVMRAQHAKLDLENRRYELVSRIVKMLQADTAPQAPVTLEIDLRDGTHPAKFFSEGKTPSGWQAKSYIDRWLSLQSRLVDGTHLRLEMIERTDKRTRTRRGSSGRTKTKTRTVSDALVRVRLQVKTEKYQHLGRLGAHARNAVRLPKGTRLKSFSVEPDRVDLTVLISDPWDVKASSAMQVNAVEVVAMSLLSLYQILNLSRAIDKKAAHA
ncbi:hypothetical protein F0U61_42320 [Archangium violaceum]|uniref:hypothetical protein n=1 Tax=Archangium violaceum TaxID=83451 RepID=UPI002B31283C|nr:hypothetical protein F0U61_42320 [Archangium violaceum]